MGKWKKAVALIATVPMLLALTPAANADEAAAPTAQSQAGRSDASQLAAEALNNALAQGGEAVEEQQSAPSAATPSTVAAPAAQSDALEENGGVTVADGDANATITDDGNFGKVLTIAGAWVSGSLTDNVPTKAVGVIKDAAPFQSTAWTFTTDAKLTETFDPTDATWSNKAAFTVGTKDQYVSLLLGNGKLVAAGKTYDLSKHVSPNEWSAASVVYSEADGTPKIAVYLDGEQVLAPTEIGVKFSTMTGVQAFIGHKYATNHVSNGVYDNIAVSNTAADEAVAKKATADRVAAKYEATAWDGIALPAETAGDVTLPSENAAGDKVAWKSGNAAVLGDDGKLVAPQEADTNVTFTATIDKNGKQFAKDYTVRVLSIGASSQADLDALDLGDLNDVRSSITLPTKGAKYGSPITWTSTDPSVISDKADGNVAPGKVTRPKDADRTVVLTARVVGASGARHFVANVKQAPAETTTTDYLFAHFTGSEGRTTDEQIYFATSHDGLQWTDTHTNTHPVLTWEDSVTGNARGKDNGVRDPYLVRSGEGDTVYLIATELSIHNRGGWGAASATTTGSTNLVIWKTHDMVHWSKPYAVDVASKIPGGAGCAWAPEAFWDEANQQYMVYWASRTEKNNEVGNAMNMYYATTRDFKTFSDPVKWIDYDVSVIDTTMMKVGDWYYRASGDGQNSIEKSKNPYAVTVANTAKEENPTKDENQWQYVGSLQEILNNKNYSGSFLEGPEFFKYNEDDIPTVNGKQMPYGLMWDQYAQGKGYLPFFTSDPGSDKADDWSFASSVNFGALKKRHGTILPITSTEYDAIMAAYNGKDDVTNQYADEPTAAKSLTVLDAANADVADTTVKVKVGEKATLTAVTSGLAEGATVSWTPKTEGVVSQSVEGDAVTFTGVKAGVTEVEVSADGLPTATFTIEVTGEGEPPTPGVESVTIAGEGVVDGRLTVREGASAQLAATIAPSDAKADVAWSSSNSAVVSVDKTGKVTGVKAGTATVTATAGGKSASIAVTVTKAEAVKPKPQPAAKPSGTTAATGAAIAGVMGVVAVLAAAGIALTVWRKRRA